MSSPPRDDREAPFPIVGRRTRSDTIDSVDSNVVDWVELSKTEATETRNEISDEVSALCILKGRTVYADCLCSLLHFFLLVLSTRTKH